MNQRVGRILSHFATLVLLLFSSAIAIAGPGKTTYQAKIVKPDGYPLEVSSVNFKFTILDPAGNCILYSETYSSVNMSSTGGLISFALGSGVKTYPASATTFEQVFSNITPSLSCDTGGPASYSPIATDIRKIVMQFHDGSGWQTLPAMSINAVPYAMFANEATKLNGLTSTDFVQVSTVPTCAASEALRHTGAGFMCIAVGNSVTSGTVITALGYTPADGASVTALTTTTNAVSTTVASVSSTVFSVSSTVASLQSSVAASFAAITSSQWTTSGTNIFYNTGNIGIGTTTPVTKLDVSGGVRIGAESTTCAPALAGTLRYNASNVEYCNGTSWQAFGVSGAGINNFNGSTSGTQSFTTGTGGTAPNFTTSNGVHTLNIPLANTGSVTAGLISNADYTTFTNKITSSAVSIAQVLGYTPANDAASGTYAQKANNLSDLTNIVTARSNLGLGSFATANTLDLGSASATGTLAIARLPSFTGDATVAAASNTIILSNSGVTTGTYTKVTVDSKGRVTSSSALASSDVTTALGYTPASATASTQWTTSGSAIYYNTGNVGIGTANPTAAKLVVSGSALIGTASMNYSGSASAAILTSGSPIIFDGGASSLARLIWSGGNLSFGKCQDTTCGPMSPYLDINTTSNITTFYNMNSVRAGNGYGTATAPTFSFGGNTDIGMFNPGSGILSFSTSGAERVRLTSVGTVGIGTTTPVTKLDVSGGVRISMESATCAASFAGTLRYNAGNVEYCNGTSWQAFGVSSSGLTSLNGSTSQTQSFTNGTGGTAPNIVTANGVHTLNIPLANAGSVTAGLISNADYTTFTNKITSSAASIAQVLGYVPADNAVSGTYAQKANNLSDLTNVVTARTNLGLGTFATANTIDLGSASATGTLAIARLPSFTGDATIAAASNTIVLSNSGVTAGTYTKVTVDTKGRVTSSSALASTDVTTALGYTPASATASTQWTTSGSAIYYNTGNVGIGTAAPGTALDVLGIISSRSSSTWGSGANSTFKAVDPNGLLFSLGLDAGNTKLELNTQYSTMPIVFSVGNSEKMRVDSAGIVGIGTTNPSYGLLDVNGGARFTVGTTNFLVDGTAASMFRSNSAGAGGANIDLLHYNNGSGILANAVTGAVNFKGSNSSGVFTTVAQFSSRMPTVSAGSEAGTLVLSTMDNGLMSDRINITGGNVGIGATTPSAKLHLAAGTSSTASFKFTSGTLLTSPQSGAMEYDGSYYYLTDGSNTRRTIATGSSAGTIDNANNINSSSNITLTPTGSVIVSATTASTNSSTGALVVKGGAGIAGNLNVAGTISGSAKVMATGFRANQGVPDAADSSTNGYAFGADGDTGMFSPGSGAANGVLAFYGNNAELMRVTASGAVGVGTTSPDLQLTVNTGARVDGVLIGEGSSTMDMAYAYESIGANSGMNLRLQSAMGIGFHTGMTASEPDDNSKTRMFITSAGTVGIGTTAPGYKLHLEGAGGTITDGFVLRSTTGGNQFGFYTSLNDFHLRSVTAGADILTATYGGNIGIGTTTPGAPLSFADSKVTKIQFNGNNANGYQVGLANSVNGGDALYKFDAGLTSAGEFGFYSAGTSKMFISSSGNVGIGTTSPGAKLDVANSNSFISNGTGANTYFRNSQSADGDYLGLGWISENVWGLSSADGSTYRTLSLQPYGGNVGIGTASPSSRLSVYGFASAESGLDVMAKYNCPLGDVTGSCGTTDENTGVNTLQRWGFSTHPTTWNLALKRNHQGWGNVSYDFVAKDASTETTAISIKYNGNVGIGTTAPTEKLHVQGNSKVGDTASTGTVYMQLLGMHDTAGGSGFRLQFDRTNDIFGIAREWSGFQSPSFVIKRSDGNVGIGTTNPSAKLSVSGTALFGANGNGHVGGVEKIHIAGANSNPTMIATTNTGIRTMFMSAGALNTIGTDGGDISFRTSASWTASDPSVDGSDRMRITAAGNVGIGTTSPAYKLQVQQTASGTPAMMIGGGFAGGPRLQTYGLDADPLAWMGLGTDMSGDNYELSIYSPASAQNGKITFGQYNGATATYTEKMRIAGNGNVGIATNNPQAKLHVAGDVRIVDGNQAAGRVLASDANGTGAWKQTIIHGTIASVGNTSNGARVGSGVSITLPPGKWQITGMGITTPTSCRADFGIRNSGTDAVIKYTLFPAATGDYQTATVTAYVDIASTTTYDLYIVSRAACASQIHTDNSLWELTATGVAY